MAETPAPHPTCLDTTTYGDLPNRTYVCGPDCPRPAGPDPARDARIDVYRDRERRRAARALDRYFEVIIGDKVGGCGDASVAGERFVEEVGDYVLARLAQSSDRDVAFNVQQNSHYDATERCVPVPDPVTGRPLHAYECGGHHNADHGARPGPRCTCVQSSDTGHDPDCPRAAFARGAAPHPDGLCGDRSCCTPMSEVYRMQGRRADGSLPE